MKHRLRLQGLVRRLSSGLLGLTTILLTNARNLTIGKNHTKIRPYLRIKPYFNTFSFPDRPQKKCVHTDIFKLCSVAKDRNWGFGFWQKDNRKKLV